MQRTYTGWLLILAAIGGLLLAVYWAASGVGRLGGAASLAANPPTPEPEILAPIEEAAAAVALAQATFDYREPGAQLQALAGLSTGRLADEIAHTDPDPYAVAWRVRADGEVRRVDVTLRGEAVARATVTVRVTVQFMTPDGEAGTRTQVDRVLRIGLRDVDGRWLAEGLTLVDERAVPQPVTGQP